MALDCCHFCGWSDVEVLHPLLECVKFVPEYAALKSRWGLSSRCQQNDAVFALFGHTSDIARILDVVHYVCAAVSQYVGNFGHQVAGADTSPDGYSRHAGVLQPAARDADALGVLWASVGMKLHTFDHTTLCARL